MVKKLDLFQLNLFFLLCIYADGDPFDPFDDFIRNRALSTIIEDQGEVHEPSASGDDSDTDYIRLDDIETSLSMSTEPQLRPQDEDETRAPVTSEGVDDRDAYLENLPQAPPRSSSLRNSADYEPPIGGAGETSWSGENGNSHDVTGEGNNVVSALSADLDGDRNHVMDLNEGSGGDAARPSHSVTFLASADNRDNFSPPPQGTTEASTAERMLGDETTADCEATREGEDRTPTLPPEGEGEMDVEHTSDLREAGEGGTNTPVARREEGGSDTCTPTPATEQENSGEAPVAVKADVGTPVGTLKETIDAVRESGVEGAGLTATALIISPPPEEVEQGKGYSVKTTPTTMGGVPVPPPSTSGSNADGTSAESDLDSSVQTSEAIPTANTPTTSLDKQDVQRTLSANNSPILRSKSPRTPPTPRRRPSSEMIVLQPLSPEHGAGLSEQYAFLRRTLSHSQRRYSQRGRTPKEKKNQQQKQQELTQKETVPNGGMANGGVVSGHRSGLERALSARDNQGNRQRRTIGRLRDIVKDENSAPSSAPTPEEDEDMETHVDQHGRTYYMDHSTHTIAFDRGTTASSRAGPAPQQREIQSRREMLDRR